MTRTCGVERDDGGQGGRLVEGHLEPVEAAPALAVHAHLAAAPGPRRQPGQQVAAVLLLLRQVLVVVHAVRVARAADVGPHDHVPGQGSVSNYVVTKL